MRSLLPALDGTVMTGGCPVGASRRRRHNALAGLRAAALAAFGIALSPASGSGEDAAEVAASGAGAAPSGVAAKLHSFFERAGEALEEKEDIAEPVPEGAEILGRMLPSDSGDAHRP